MSGNVSNHVWVEDATKSLGGYWVRENGTADGYPLVKLESSIAAAGETRFARAVNGGVGLVPGAAVTAASADIPVWTFPAGIRRAFFNSEADEVAGNNVIGWWVTWNAGNAVTAKARLVLAMATAVYASGATVDGDTNSASIFVPANGEVFVPDGGEDITDVYLMPLSSAGTIVGNGLLSGVFS